MNIEIANTLEIVVFLVETFRSTFCPSKNVPIILFQCKKNRAVIILGKLLLRNFWRNLKFTSCKSAFSKLANKIKEGDKNGKQMDKINKR